MASDILTSEQYALLEAVGATPLAKQFYLTGGTALAGFYLRHRYSEDLDFFSEQEIDPLALNVTAKQIKKDLAIKEIDFQQSFNRNLVFWHTAGGNVVKTEFTYFPFPRIETGISKHSMVIDSLIDLAVNKLFTIYQRSAARDYIDLYSICREKKWLINDLVKQAKAKFDWHIDPLQLGTQFVKAEQASDFPRMIKDVPPQEWQSFFLSEAKKLKPNILS